MCFHFKNHLEPVDYENELLLQTILYSTMYTKDFGIYLLLWCECMMKMINDSYCNLPEALLT